MKKTVHQLVISVCIALISIPSFSEAPVVDANENFALFDEPLAADQQPESSLQEDNDTAFNHSEMRDDVPLAHDDNASEMNLPDNKLQSLQQELNELRGQLEVQNHALQTLQQQQLDFYKNIEKQFTDNKNILPKPLDNQVHAENHINPLTAIPSPPRASRNNPAEEQISYLAAYEFVKNKEIDKGVMAMKTFIQHYPYGGYTANAHYWLGELYLLNQSYADAIQQFETVLSKFPNSSKSSASLLKLGYALAGAGQKELARERLKSVIRDYPDTSAAKLAAAKLEKLNS